MFVIFWKGDDTYLEGGSDRTPFAVNRNAISTIQREDDYYTICINEGEEFLSIPLAGDSPEEALGKILTHIGNEGH